MIDKNPHIATDVYDEYVWGEHGYRLVVPRDSDLYEKLMQETPDDVGRYNSLKKIVREMPSGLSGDDRYKKLVQAGYDGLTLYLLKRQQKHLPKNLRGKAGSKYAAAISATIDAAEKDMQASKFFYGALFTFAALATFFVIPFGFFLSGLAALAVAAVGVVAVRRAQNSVLRNYKIKMDNLHEAEKQRLIKLIGAAPAEITARMAEAKALEAEAERIQQKAKALREGTIKPEEAPQPAMAAVPVALPISAELAPKRAGPKIRINNSSVLRA